MDNFLYSSNTYAYGRYSIFDARISVVGWILISGLNNIIKSENNANNLEAK